MEVLVQMILSPKLLPSRSNLEHQPDSLLDPPDLNLQNQKKNPDFPLDQLKLSLKVNHLKNQMKNLKKKIVLDFHLVQTNLIQKRKSRVSNLFVHF